MNKGGGPRRLPAAARADQLQLHADDNGSYQIVLTVSDEDGGSTTVDQTISVANVAPSPSIVSIGAPRVEGTPIAVTGTATDPAGANDTLTYAWTVNKDGGRRRLPAGRGADWSFTPTTTAVTRSC